MPDQPTDLYPLQKKDITKADAVLTEAFQDDPLWSRVMGALKPQQRSGLFEVPIRYCLRYGQVYAPSEQIEGLIAWVPGHLAGMPLWRIIRSGAIRPALRMASQFPPEMRAAFKPVEADRKANMQGRPFLYLPALGVASAFQGQGFGGRLLGALIAQSEAQGLPIYLETESQGNVRWYEKAGFEVMKEINLPVIDLPMWEMVRWPRR